MSSEKESNGVAAVGPFDKAQRVEKNYNYYNKLEERMNLKDNDSVWDYVFSTHIAEDKEFVKNNIEPEKIIENSSQILLHKAGQMIFSKVILDRKQKLGLGNLKLSETHSSFFESPKIKEFTANEIKGTSSLLDNLKETGASSILSYIDKSSELVVQNASNLLNSVSKLMLSKIKTTKKSITLVGEVSSNLEQNLNMKKFLANELKNFKGYDYLVERDLEIEKDMCSTKIFRLRRSIFSTFFCAQYFKMGEYLQDTKLGRNPREYNCMQGPQYLVNEQILKKKNKKTITDLPSAQRIQIAKFSPDGHSMALGCTDGNVILLRYNNESSKLDFFQQESTVFKRNSSNDNSVVDLAWSMVVIMLTLELRNYNGFIPRQTVNPVVNRPSRRVRRRRRRRVLRPGR